MGHIKFDSRWETIYQYIGRALFEATEKNVVLDFEFNGGKLVVEKLLLVIGIEALNSIKIRSVKFEKLVFFSTPIW